MTNCAAINHQEVMREYKRNGIVDAAITLAIRLSTADEKMQASLIEEFDTVFTVFDCKKHGVDPDTFAQYLDALQSLCGAEIVPVELDDDPAFLGRTGD